MSNLFDILQFPSNSSLKENDSDDIANPSVEEPSDKQAGKDGNQAISSTVSPTAPKSSKGKVEQSKKSTGSSPAASLTTSEKVPELDTLKQFTIPKKKKAKKELLEEVSLDSNEFSREISPVITASFKDRNVAPHFKISRAFFVHNEDLLHTFQERRKKLRQDGYSEKELLDSYGFYYVEKSDQVHKICEEGIKIGNAKTSCLGCADMGVSLCRHADIISPNGMPHGMSGILIIFKFMKGKVKTMVENYGDIALDPTPNFDCHVSKSPNIDLQTTPSQQAFDSTQIYIYEYNEDLDLEERPGQICPIGFVHFTYTGEGRVVRPVQPKANPRTVGAQRSSSMTSQRSPVTSGMSPSASSPGQMPPPHMRSPILPASPITADSPVPPPSCNVGKETDGDGCVVWVGQLATKGIAICNVEMLAFGSALRPARIGPEMNVELCIEWQAIRERYIAPLATHAMLPRDVEMCAKGRFYNYALLRPTDDSQSRFNQIMTYLNRKESGANIKLEDNIDLIVLTNCPLTQHLGLSEAHNHALVLHCIFISTTSRRAQLTGVGVPIGHDASQMVVPAAAADLRYQAGMGMSMAGLQGGMLRGAPLLTGTGMPYPTQGPIPGTPTDPGVLRPTKDLVKKQISLDSYKKTRLKAVSKPESPAEDAQETDAAEQGQASPSDTVRSGDASQAGTAATDSVSGGGDGNAVSQPAPSDGVSAAVSAGGDAGKPNVTLGGNLAWLKPFLKSNVTIESAAPPGESVMATSTSTSSSSKSGVMSSPSTHLSPLCSQLPLPPLTDEEPTTTSEQSSTSLSPMAALRQHIVSRSPAKAIPNYSASPPAKNASPFKTPPCSPISSPFASPTLRTPDCSPIRTPQASPAQIPGSLSLSQVEPVPSMPSESAASAAPFISQISQLIQSFQAEKQPIGNKGDLPDHTSSDLSLAPFPTDPRDFADSPTVQPPIIESYYTKKSGSTPPRPVVEKPATGSIPTYVPTPISRSKPSESFDPPAYVPTRFRAYDPCEKMPFVPAVLSGEDPAEQSGDRAESPNLSEAKLSSAEEGSPEAGGTLPKNETVLDGVTKSEVENPSKLIDIKPKSELLKDDLSVSGKLNPAPHKTEVKEENNSEKLSSVVKSEDNKSSDPMKAAETSGKKEHIQDNISLFDKLELELDLDRPLCLGPRRPSDDCTPPSEKTSVIREANATVRFHYAAYTPNLSITVSPLKGKQKTTAKPDALSDEFEPSEKVAIPGICEDEKPIKKEAEKSVKQKAEAPQKSLEPKLPAQEKVQEVEARAKVSVKGEKEAPVTTESKPSIVSKSLPVKTEETTVKSEQPSVKTEVPTEIAAQTAVAGNPADEASIEADPEIIDQLAAAMPPVPPGKKRRQIVTISYIAVNADPTQNRVVSQKTFEKVVPATVPSVKTMAATVATTTIATSEESAATSVQTTTTSSVKVSASVTQTKTSSSEKKSPRSKPVHQVRIIPSEPCESLAFNQEKANKKAASKSPSKGELQPVPSKDSLAKPPKSEKVTRGEGDGNREADSDVIIVGAGSKTPATVIVIEERDGREVAVTKPVSPSDIVDNPKISKPIKPKAGVAEESWDGKLVTPKLEPGVTHEKPEDLGEVVLKPVQKSVHKNIVFKRSQKTSGDDEETPAEEQGSLISVISSQATPAVGAKRTHVGQSKINPLTGKPLGSLSQQGASPAKRVATSADGKHVSATALSPAKRLINPLTGRPVGAAAQQARLAARLPAASPDRKRPATSDADSGKPKLLAKSMLPKRPALRSRPPAGFGAPNASGSVQPLSRLRPDLLHQKIAVLEKKRLVSVSDSSRSDKTLEAGERPSKRKYENITPVVGRDCTSHRSQHTSSHQRTSSYQHQHVSSRSSSSYSDQSKYGSNYVQNPTYTDPESARGDVDERGSRAGGHGSSTQSYYPPAPQYNTQQSSYPAHNPPAQPAYPTPTPYPASDPSASQLPTYPSPADAYPTAPSQTPQHSAYTAPPDSYQTSVQPSSYPATQDSYQSTSGQVAHQQSSYPPAQDAYQTASAQQTPYPATHDAYQTAATQLPQQTAYTATQDSYQATTAQQSAYPASHESYQTAQSHVAHQTAYPAPIESYQTSQAEVPPTSSYSTVESYQTAQATYPYPSQTVAPESYQAPYQPQASSAPASHEASYAYSTAAVSSTSHASYPSQDSSVAAYPTQSAAPTAYDQSYTYAQVDQSSQAAQTHQPDVNTVSATSYQYNQPYAQPASHPPLVESTVSSYSTQHPTHSYPTSQQPVAATAYPPTEPPQQPPISSQHPPPQHPPSSYPPPTNTSNYHSEPPAAAPASYNQAPQSTARDYSYPGQSHNYSSQHQLARNRSPSPPRYHQQSGSYSHHQPPVQPSASQHPAPQKPHSRNQPPPSHGPPRENLYRFRNPSPPRPTPSYGPPPQRHPAPRGPPPQQHDSQRVPNQYQPDGSRPGAPSQASENFSIRGPRPQQHPPAHGHIRGPPPTHGPAPQQSAPIRGPQHPQVRGPPPQQPPHASRSRQHPEDRSSGQPYRNPSPHRPPASGHMRPHGPGPERHQPAGGPRTSHPPGGPAQQRGPPGHDQQQQQHRQQGRRQHEGPPEQHPPYRDQSRAAPHGPRHRMPQPSQPPPFFRGPGSVQRFPGPPRQTGPASGPPRHTGPPGGPRHQPPRHQHRHPRPHHR